MTTYYVIEGNHTDPNDQSTIDQSTENRYGPMSEDDADNLAKTLIQRNIDNYYHRAWVIEQ
jgi:hypothetical protein